MWLQQLPVPHTRLDSRVARGSKTGLVRKPQGARGSCWKHLAEEAKCEREIGVGLYCIIALFVGI
jgi:hypothetical protein